MRKIALSYRRADSSAIAGRIQEHLANHFGSDEVFMDIDAIPFGEDFRDYIDEALKHAVAMVLLIGPKWLGTRRRGVYRIQEATDPVRIEVETAMRLGLRIVPVLVEGATMPQPSDLPESLAKLSFINAATVDSGRDFRIHMERVIHALEVVLERAGVSVTAVTAPEPVVAPVPPIDPAPVIPPVAPPSVARAPVAPAPVVPAPVAAPIVASAEPDGAAIAERIAGAWWITLIRGIGSILGGAYLVANVAHMHNPSTAAGFSLMLLAFQLIVLVAMIVVSRGARVAQFAFGAELLIDLIGIVSMPIRVAILFNAGRIAAEAVAGRALGRYTRAEYARAIVLPIVFAISVLTIVAASTDSSMAVYYAGAASTIEYGIGFVVLAFILLAAQKRAAP